MRMRENERGDVEKGGMLMGRTAPSITQGQGVHVFIPSAARNLLLHLK